MMRRTSQPSPQAAWRTRPGALATAAVAGSTHQASAPLAGGKLHDTGGRHALALHLALELAKTIVDDVQGAAHGGCRLAHLVREPTHVPQEERTHPLLDDGAGRPLRLDGHHGIDEGGGVDHPQRVAQVTAPPGHRRMGQEELVELALELGRQVAGRSPQTDLLGDLGHDLLHVGLGISRQHLVGIAHDASLAQPG